MRVLGCALIAAGCGFHTGSLGEGPPITPDARLDASVDTAIDTAIDTPRQPPDADVPCFAAWGPNAPDLGPVTPLAAAPNASQSVNTTQHFERDPFLAPDELTIYFARGDAIGDLFVGVRNAIADPFVVEQTALANVSSNGDDSKLSFDTANQAFLATTAGGGAIHVVTATRTALDAFGPTSETGLDAVNLPGTRVFDPMVSPDGTRLYFAGELDQENQVQTIQVAARGSTTAAWGPPAPVGGVNSGQGDADPTVANGDLLMVWSRRDPGGTAHLFYATRAHRDDSFGPPVALPLGPTQNDGDPWLSPDGCRLYFASDRAGTYDLYEVTVTP